jgi:hypothetical protein
MQVSDPAHVELTAMPMVNDAMASVHAAVTTAFEIAVRLHILIFLFRKVVDLRCDYRRCADAQTARQARAVSLPVHPNGDSAVPS